MKDYHDKKNNATLHNFKIGDIVFCANMKPAKLDSQFHPAKHVIIQSQGRDTFTLVNAATGTTLIRNAKYLKRAPTNENEEIVDTSNDEKSNGSSSSSDLANVESSDTIHKHSDARVWKVTIPMIKPLRIKAMSRLGPDV